MIATPSGDTTISSAPFFFGVAADAPPVGDTRVLSVLFFLYVFLFSTGVLQIAASYNRMRGLAFFSNVKAGYAFGVLFIVCGNLMFFLSGDRNVIAPRLEGTQLLGWTFLGLICSLVMTLAIAYYINRRHIEDVDDAEVEGMEALNQQVYPPLIERLWRRIKRKG